jgi:hypothetical protein
MTPPAITPISKPVRQSVRKPAHKPVNQSASPHPLQPTSQPISQPVSQLNSFITSPPNTDLSNLIAALKANHINILDRPSPSSPRAILPTDQLIDSIHQADLIVGILGPAATSGNVLFELGCASALGKKSLVIIPDPSELPSNLKSLVHIRTTPDDREGICRALEQILHKPELTQDPNTSGSVDQTQPLTTVANDLLEKLNALGKTPSAHSLKSIVLEILGASKIPTKAQHNHPDLHHDFSIWVTELEAYFGNPIPIDLKGQLQTAGQAKYAAEQTLTYMTLSSARTALLLATQITPEARQIAATYPNLYFFDLYEFLKRLEQESLGKILRQARNARVQARLR